MMWLDMLRTPMAAPETPALKAMRRAILWSAIALAIAICALQPLRAVLGIVSLHRSPSSYKVLRNPGRAVYAPSRSRRRNSLPAAERGICSTKT